MVTNIEYIIPYKSLHEGSHEFNMLIGKTFIEMFQFEDVENAQIQVKIDLIKGEQLLELEIIGNGFVTVPCDRCLDAFPLEISFQNSLIVKIDANESQIIDENLIHLSMHDESLDLAQYLYESIVLALPLQKVHPINEKGEVQCDENMLKYLKKKNTKSKISDPRWDALKNIKL